MTMKRIKADDKNTAQLIFNSFLCCFGLRAGSLVMACVHVVSIIRTQPYGAKVTLNNIKFYPANNVT
jgi:hypothetical protein